MEKQFDRLPERHRATFHALASSITPRSRLTRQYVSPITVIRGTNERGRRSSEPNAKMLNANLNQAFIEDSRETKLRKCLMFKSESVICNDTVQKLQECVEITDGNLYTGDDYDRQINFFNYMLNEIRETNKELMGIHEMVIQLYDKVH